MLYACKGCDKWLFAILLKNVNIILHAKHRDDIPMASTHGNTKYEYLINFFHASFLRRNGGMTRQIA